MYRAGFFLYFCLSLHSSSFFVPLFFLIKIYYSSQYLISVSSFFFLFDNKFIHWFFFRRFASYHHHQIGPPSIDIYYMYWFVICHRKCFALKKKQKNDIKSKQSLYLFFLFIQNKIKNSNRYHRNNIEKPKKKKFDSNNKSWGVCLWIYNIS